MSPDIDDPRLTAFALGELPESERPEVERLLADRPELAREVEQIRLTARWLSEQFHEEQAREAAVTPAAAAPPLRLVAADVSTPAPAPAKPRSWVRSPWVAAAAACLILGVSTALLMPAMQPSRLALTLPASKFGLDRDEKAVDSYAAAPAAASSAPTTGPMAVTTDGAAVARNPRGATAATPSLGIEVAANQPVPTPDFNRHFGVKTGVAAPADGLNAAGAPGASAHSALAPAPVAAPAILAFDAAKPSEPAYARFKSLKAGREAKRRAPGEPDGPVLAQQAGGQAGDPALGQFGREPGQGQARQQAGKDFGGEVALRASEAKSLKAEARFADNVPGDGNQSSANAERGALADVPTSLALAKERDSRAESEKAGLDIKRKLTDQLAEAEDQQQAIGEGLVAEAQAPAQAPREPVVVEENPFVLTSQEAASTFAIDVDTASYSIVRRSLMQQNRLPSPDEVRIEEMINYFPYQDAPPQAASPDPFAVHVESARCPWNAANRLARIGIMGRPLGQEARKPSNLVFLVDVSGSMDQPNKLPLVQWGLQKLVEQLGENDRVAIAVYAGSSGLVLPSTSAMNKPAILSKIEELRAGGSTNGGAGIQLAYDQAAAGFINNGINRVILATDGDFNVGVTDQDELVSLVEAKAKGAKPVFLTVLGFGMDNLKDGTLEKLADKGNGHYAYIDQPEEAHKVLVEEMGATLDVIAKDVKIQVEFKPELVRAYRLVGYENRVMPNQDFRDDQKDGGEIGAGHHVTALYEYVPAEAAPAPPADGGPSPASFVVRLRYKQPQGDVATEIERPAVDRGVDYADASDDFKFASSVAGFGMILRNSPSVGSLTLPGVVELASPTLAHDPSGYRREFMGLVQKARDLREPALAAPVEP